jgi:hypothetical protein
LTEWLNQLKFDGHIFLEHTEAHGPEFCSEMDPFGVRPHAVPFVLAAWFGPQIGIRVEKVLKANMDRPAWIFVINKTCKSIKCMNSDALEI